MMVFLIIGLVLVSALLIYIIICLILIKKIHNGFFNHRQEYSTSLKSYTNEDFNVFERDYVIEDKYGKIAGNFLYGEYFASDKLVIVCHGMWSTKEAYIQEAGFIASRGLLSFVFDYQGTNESTGDNLIGFSNSIYSLDRVLKHFENNPEYNDKDIYLVGHSWGGYAALNAVRLHPNVKGVVGIAPMASVYSIVHFSNPKKPVLFSLLFDLYEGLKLGFKYHGNIIRSLRKYQGKVILVHSKDDKTCQYRGSTGKVKRKLKNKKNIEYVIVDGKNHNPHYTLESVKKLYEFESILRSSSNKEEILKNVNLKELGVIDEALFDDVLKKLEVI